MGCQSFSSTMLNRLGDNAFVGNSNGTADGNSAARPFRGIPVTLRVPSHLDVYIEELCYMKDDGDDKAALSGSLTGTRILNVRTEVVSTKKVFTVEYKRPASGTLNLETNFSDEQYFRNISRALQDTTIVDSANLMNTTFGGTSDPARSSGRLPALVPPTVPGAGPQTEQPAAVPSGPTAAQATVLTNHVRDTRIVAFQRFDINDPDYEFQVDRFVSRHLNNCDRCGRCGRSPTYDKTIINVQGSPIQPTLICAELQQLR